jgi:predicted DsbA family dithiol-disulfide isomerase
MGEGWMEWVRVGNDRSRSPGSERAHNIERGPHPSNPCEVALPLRTSRDLAVGRSLEPEVGIASDLDGGVRIRFAFDYVDPGSYLAFELIERWLREWGAAVPIDWEPLELRTPEEAPLDGRDPGWLSIHRAMEEVAWEENLTLARAAHVPRTRKAHELAFHAREKGLFDAVHAALFRAHFSGSRDIGRIDHLVEVGAAEGLEAAETRTVLGVDRFLPMVQAARERSLTAGTRGVPVLQVGDRRLEGLSGAAPLRRFLSEALERD